MKEALMTKRFKKGKFSEDHSGAGNNFSLPHRLLMMMRSSAFSRGIRSGIGEDAFNSGKIYRDVHYLMDRIRRHE